MGRLTGIDAPVDSSGAGRGEERAPAALFNPARDPGGVHAASVVDALASLGRA
jgi:hypothetical protein